MDDNEQEIKVPEGDPVRVIVTWTPSKLKRFKRAYMDAVGCKRKEFTFDGNQFFVGYAKYLIEYIENKFKQP